VRAVKMMLLIVGLMLCGRMAFAQTGEPPQPSLPAQTSARSQLPPPSQPPPSQAPSTSHAPAPSKTAPPHYSADGLYNLANSYARAGKPGLAVLNYERAALLAPDDADINANLEYVRASAHVPPEPTTRFSRTAKAVSPALAAWIGVLGIALVGAGLLVGKRTARFRWARTVGVVLGVMLIALTVCNAMFFWPRMREAVILVNQTPARVTPVPMGDTAFVLPEAQTVTMTAEHEDFVLVRTRGGSIGWVARANLGAVVP
jgi:type IV secretory pathway VirB2 component (pilin)